MSLSHRSLATWYHQLAQQLDAGLSLVDAARLSHASGAPKEGLESIAQTIEAGGSVDDALSSASSWLPFSDRLFLSAAASAGQMPRTLRVLSVRHAQLGAAKLRALLACLYPAAILHLGLLLLPLVRMIDWERGFEWSAAIYVRGLALTLLPVWFVGIVVFTLLKRENCIVARLARMTPIIGSYLRSQALADFSFGLGTFLESGVPIDRAWAAAGLISQSPDLKNAAESMAPVIARGQAPGAHLAATNCFPPEFIALYRTGEVSGQLDQNLLRLSTQQHEKAQQALSLATVVYPGVMFLGVAVGVGYFVVSLYGGYLKMLTGMME